MGDNASDDFSDVDVSGSDLTDHEDIYVGSTPATASVAMRATNSASLPATGGKGLPVSSMYAAAAAMAHENGIYNDDDDDGFNIDDGKDLIGTKFDEDPLDDDDDNDDALSSAESIPEKPEDLRDDFKLVQSRPIKIKFKPPVGVVEKTTRPYKRKMKIVSFDPVQIPIGEKSAGIDKLLSYRVTKEGVEELLVKYKSMSYYHVEWIPRASMEMERGAKNRIRKFLEKPSWDHYSEDEPFNPAFAKVDRIIDVGENGSNIMYLVKWCAQPYEHSTWESMELMQQIDPDKITEYTERNTLKQDRRVSYTLPGRRYPTGRWKKLNESPIYKNDNMLRPYQLEGLDWLLFCWYNQQNSILADEMGLGKTVQSTVFLYELYRQEGLKGPFLVVTPLSTIGNWEREIRGWTDMNVVVYHGSQPSRNLIVETEFYFRDSAGQIIPDNLKFDIILTTYEMAMSGAAQLRPIPWRCVVLDEAHRLKNRTSKVSEILKTYNMEHRVLLTGTPLQNSLDELWALLNFLEPQKFASEQDFKINYGALKSAADVERLQALLKPLMLRRLKEGIWILTTDRLILTDVEKSIPVKEETIIEVELTTTQKKWYRSILEKNFSWLKQGISKKGNVPQLINTMIELRKCCIHPWLLKGAEDQILEELNARSADQQFQALVQSSGKMVLIDKLLRKLKQGGHKVLIFSQMTKCLDLIQDYLRARGWLYERIDGGVRSDLRQASIDRFSTPGSESFVFLLCTRAGGVGINLTAADTCIIFDSDWNPQNDLQAQSRCHRIGQKKSVKIYRLITRNTYEREMFDRASMKLGLDKALLQRMDSQSGGDSAFTGFDLGSNGKSSGLSSEEVEELLKKGAYGAFMDDDVSKQFCDEDIDQILERRTQVIRHDNSEEKSSIFSKASFQAPGSAADVDVNDPDFWDKVAKQAQLQIADDTVPEEFLIIDVPRNRRQVSRFGKPEEIEYVPQEPEIPPSPERLPTPPPPPPPPKPKDELKLWSLTERTRLERMLMQHGFNNWHKIRETFSRRSIYDLQVCCRILLTHCLKTCNTVEPEIAKDVKRALECFPVPTEKPEGPPGPQDFERRTYILNEMGEEEEPQDPPDVEAEDVPYPWANEKQITEYRSFWREVNKEYIEHIEKKAKNMLIRVALMFNIRNKCDPRPDMFIPKFLGAPPAPWWGDAEDKDLMIGVAKHGYQQKYNKLWEDPELCFYERFQNAAAMGGTIVEAAPAANGEDDMDDIGGEMADPAAKEDIKVEVAAAVEAKVDVSNDIDVKPPAEGEDAIMTDVKTENQHFFDDGVLFCAVKLQTQQAASTSQPSSNEPIKFVVPSATDLGVRVRRILNAMSKYRQFLVREKQRKDTAEARNRQRDLEKAEKAKQREKDFSKKQRHDFQRVLTMCGLPRIRGSPDKTDWELFKRMAELDKKSDEAMEYYYQKVMNMSREVISANETLKNRTIPELIASAAAVTTTQTAESADGTADTSGAPLALTSTDTVDPALDPALTVLTLEKAKKIVKRVEMFEKLRSGILTDDSIDKKLQAVRRHGKASMPKWWEYALDKPLLIGIERHGLQHPEDIFQDPSLPFLDIFKDYERSMVERREKNIPNQELVWEKFEEKFWPREALIVKRFELLVNYASRPLSKKAAAARKPQLVQSGLVAAMPGDNATNYADGQTSSSSQNAPSKILKLKLKMGPTLDEAQFENGTAGSSVADMSSESSRLDSTQSGLPSAILGDPQRGSRISPSGNPGKPRKSSKLVKQEPAKLRTSVDGLSDASSGGNTDDMIEAAGKRIPQKKKKRPTEFEGGDVLPPVYTNAVQSDAVDVMGDEALRPLAYASGSNLDADDIRPIKKHKKSKRPISLDGHAGVSASSSDNSHHLSHSIMHGHAHQSQLHPQYQTTPLYQDHAMVAHGQYSDPDGLAGYHHGDVSPQYQHPQHAQHPHVQPPFHHRSLSQGHAPAAPQLPAPFDGSPNGP
eukprot:jgi/Hompol1/2132/HPOL_002827-RA